MTEKKPTVLAIMAHPDDIEFTCAGTLVALHDAGCPIVMINVARGDGGSATLEPDEIARVRLAEARKAASLIDAQHYCGGFDDLVIYRNDDSVRRVTELVRRANPDIVFTHPPADYMSDHEETSRLVRDACFYASMPRYATREADASALRPAPPALYYADPVEGVDYYGNPAPADFYVDISEVMDRKIAMLCCHESQREWLRQQHGLDEYTEMLDHWNRKRGAEVGLAHAEAFRQYRGHGFPQTNVLADLLGNRVIQK